MSYSGGQINTNWLTLGYNGVSNPTITSEQIPVVVDTVTKYSFSVTAAIDNANWASGFTLTLTFYTASNSIVSSVTASSATLVSGVQQTVVTTPTVAPATSSYCAVQLQLNGAPASTNPLDVFEAVVLTSNNTNIPDVLNYNYAFVNGTWPWVPSNSAVLNLVSRPLSGAQGNFDSLVIGGIIELIGGSGVPCAIPTLTDPVSGNSAVFRISTPGGQLQTLSGGSGPYNLGDFQPTQDFVESLLLDGERPFGSRSSNRQMEIPIAIYAPTQQTLDAARDYLLSVIDQQYFEIAWTPKSTGLTTIYECFRALPSTIMYGFNNLREGAPGAPAIGMVSVSIQAMPFGKSGIDGVVEVDFASGLVNGSGTSASTVLDTTAGSNAGMTQWAFSVTGSVTTSFPIAYPGTPVAAGNSILVTITSLTNNVTGVTDAAGNSYTQVTSSTNQAGSMRMFTYLASNVSALTGAITIAITGGAATYVAVAFVIPGAASVRGSATYSGTSTPSAGALAGVQYNDLQVAIPFALGTGPSVPAGWSAFNEFGNGYNYNVQYKTATTSQTLNYSTTLAANWGLSLIDFITTSVDSPNGWISNTQYPVIGSGCAFHREPAPIKSPYAPLVYQQSFAATSIVGLPVISVWFGQSYDSQFAADPKFKSNVTMSLTLYDSQGRTLGAQATVNAVPWNANPTKPTWKQISLAVPQRNAKFSYGSVVGFKIQATNWTGGGQSGYVRMNAWLGYVAANPLSVTNVSSPRGILYNMFGLVGSARSQISAQVQFPNADPVIQEFTQSGTFQVPAGVTSLEAECWAAGGAGASVSLGLPGGGGGGGEYAMEPSIVVTPGNKIPVTIGAGGQAAAITPTVALYSTHGVGSTWTCPANVTTALVECWGGGAAGAPGGGGGGAGGYTTNTVPVVPGTVYSMWIGSGGQPNTGTTSQALASRGGQNTWFGPKGTTSITGAWVGAYGGTSPSAGSASGGQGGKGRPVTQLGIYLSEAWQGGGGGRSPGGAGGGGGAAGGLSGPGGPGLASPKLGTAAAGDYLTGGPGGTGPGGDGGAGASVPGAALPGVTPGGGGGGGYTRTVNSTSGVKAVNYQGAAGAPGQVQITYIPSSPSPAATPSVYLTGFANFTGTSHALTASGAGSIPAGASAVLTATYTSACSIGILDADLVSNGNWNFIGTNGSGPFTSIWWTNSISGADMVSTHVSISSNVSQAYAVSLYATPHVTGVGGSVSATGTSTSPSVGALAATIAGDLELALFTNASANTNGVPAGWSALPTIGGGSAPFCNGFWRVASAAGGDTCATTYASSQTWAAVNLDFSVNYGGTAVSGGNTVFGSSGTTSKIVTANGGASAAANSAAGGAGGTGSTNTSKFFGGKGALAGRNSNALLNASSGNTSQLGHNTSTNSTTLAIASTATLTAAFMEPGAMVMVTVQSSAALTNFAASDDAGNIYYQAAQEPLTDGSYLTVYVATLAFPITSSNTFTLTVGNAVNTVGTWGAISGVRDLEDTAIAVNAGSSATASVARTYPDTSATYYEVFVVGNNGSTNGTGTVSNAPGFSIFGGQLNGTLGVATAGRLATGSSNAVTVSSALGGSVPWAMIALPFVAANQGGQVVPITPAANGFTGTTGTYTNGTLAANHPLDAGAGMMLVTVNAGGSNSSTVGVTDSGTNTYTLLASRNTNTGKIYLFGSAVAHNLTGSWTMTVTSSVSQGYDINAFFVPGATAADSTGIVTTGATGTAISVATAAPTTANDLTFWVVGYQDTTDKLPSVTFNGSVQGFKLTQASVDASRTLVTDFAVSQNIGLGAPTISGTLSGSETWGLIGLGFKVPGYSGGGGSSGGTGGNGVDGTNGASGGGPAYTFGGKGANGVTGPAGGLIGAIPGGGGSGAALTAAGGQAGGTGGAGMIRVTYQPPLISFNDFLLHRPGQFAPADLVPLVPIPVSDPPDNREYTVPQTVAGRSAKFGGTYTVLLCAALWDTPGNSRRISVTVNQYAYPGGPAVSVQATRTLTPATDIVNGYVSMGEVTLPIKQVDNSNTDGYYTVSIHDTDQNDSFQDLMFLDTQGQTCLVNIAPGTAGDSQYVNYYYDEPNLDTDLGKLLGSSHERDRAISVLDMAMPTGGPLYVTAGDNLLLVYSSKGAPNLLVTYSPRWYSDRIV